MTLLFSTIQATEALLWFLVIDGLAALAKRWLGRSSVRRVIDGATAAIFIFFGARLALDS
jgi:threonine/homoserine/homoserine lactone efflux protein